MTSPRNGHTGTRPRRSLPGAPGTCWDIGPWPLPPQHSVQCKLLQYRHRGYSRSHQTLRPTQLTCSHGICLWSDAWKCSHVKILAEDPHLFKRLSELSPIILLLTEAWGPALPPTLFSAVLTTLYSSQMLAFRKRLQGTSAESGHTKCVIRCSACSWLFIKISEKSTQC